ncbi:MAG TPA: A/G-specific adenine glycosylase [Polyangiaceae bacterium]|nr:A/G-specific adenine glycosylase [Polyangiaceae bacterium]
MAAKSALRGIVAPLLAWYDQVRRDLPFRRTRDPYAIWVSEVMLQQTQVSTVLPYYERWMRRFPTVGHLAVADEADVLHAWQGLGYYSRARSLLRAARVVAERHAGELPRSTELLLDLPGIGPYSAGAIASIAFEQRVPVVDGNVVRVLCRLLELEGDPARSPLKQELWARAAELVPETRPGDFNQALMELGATLCIPQKPGCPACPLRDACKAHASGRAELLPQLAARPPTTQLRMATAVLARGGCLLVLQADAGAKRWAGMWQFPAVELQAGETELAAAERAAALAISGAVGRLQHLGVLKHSVTRYRITLSAFAGTPTKRSAEGSHAQRAQWLSLEELAAVAMPAAHRRVLRWATSNQRQLASEDNA